MRRKTTTDSAANRSTSLATLEASTFPFTQASALESFTDEQLESLWHQAEHYWLKAILVQGAVAAELRRRYGHYGGAWTARGAKLLGTYQRNVHRASKIWDAFHEREEDMKLLGSSLCLICASAEDPERAIDYAVAERKNGRRKGLVARDTRSRFAARLSRPFTFGAPLNFRNLRHEPIDEQGVVFLFGLIAADLGFLVEAVRQSFPDCRAKRRIADRFREVKIEFEFRSCNFAEHGHDPEGCDIIVCWQHDWPDCPPQLEVIELKSEIERLVRPPSTPPG